jgi:WD domain, G-beta repeat
VKPRHAYARTISPMHLHSQQLMCVRTRTPPLYTRTSTRTRTCAPLHHAASDSDSSDSDDDDGDAAGGGSERRVGAALDATASAADDRYQLPVGHEVTLQGHSRAVSCLAVEHTGSRLIAGSLDYTLRMFDFNSMKSDLRSFREFTPSDGHPVLAVSWSPSGDAFLCVTGSAQPRVYDRDGRLLGECVRGDMYIRDVKNTKGHITSCTAGMWHPVERHTAMTCSEDGTVRCAVERRCAALSCAELCSFDSCLSVLPVMLASPNTILHPIQHKHVLIPAPHPCCFVAVTTTLLQCVGYRVTQAKDGCQAHNAICCSCWRKCVCIQQEWQAPCCGPCGRLIAGTA